MAGSFGGTVKLTGESEYTKALKTITSNLTVMASEMKVVSSQYDKNDKSVQAITSRNNILNKEIEEGNKKISTYKSALEDFNKQQDKNAVSMMDMMLNLEKENKKLEELKNNTSSTTEEIRAQEKVINNLSTELAQAESQYEKNKITINKYQKEMNLAQAEVNKLTSELNDNQKELEDNRSTYQKMNDVIEEQKNKLSTLREKYASVVLEQGKNSAEAKNLKSEIKNLSENIKENETRMSKATKEIDGFTQSEKEAGTETLKLGDIIKANLTSEAIIAGVKGLASAMGTITKGIVSLGKEALSSYADFEQLVGGVETLFALSDKEIEAYAKVYGLSVDEVKADTELMNSSINEVLGYANQAYKTAGLSANDYMSTVTSFSASLLQSLEQDSFEASQVANRAIIDMSDNANKMGTDMSMIQSAYQGFAKQNYTMLDNLKLGYGGTKTEMARLIADASKMKDIQKQLGIEVDASSMSFGNIVNAISVMQESMGIAGTTAKEATETISGSLASMGSAWKNLLTGLAQDQVDLESLIYYFVESVVTVGDNIIPRVGTIINGIVELVMKLPMMIMDHMPSILKAGMDILQKLMDGITMLIPELLPVVLDIITNIVKFVTDNLPTILQTGITILVELIKGISQTLPELIPMMVRVIMDMVNILLDNIDVIIECGIQLLVALIEGIMNALPELIARLPEIIIKLTNTLIQLTPQLLSASLRIIQALANGLIKYVPEMLSRIPEIIKSMINAFKQGWSDFKNIGKNLLEGLWNGMSNTLDWLKNKIKSLVGDVTKFIKKMFGIKSPSTLFRDEIGTNLALGIGEGFTDEMDNVMSDIEDAIPTDFDLGLNTSITSAGTTESTSFSKEMMVDAFKEALSGMTFKAFDETFGELVIDNVEKVVYS